MSVTLSGHTQTKTIGVSWSLTCTINPKVLEEPNCRYIQIIFFMLLSICQNSNFQAVWIIVVPENCMEENQRHSGIWGSVC